MRKVNLIILLSIVLGSLCLAQQKPFGYKIAGNGDLIVSDAFFIQDGFVLDSVRNITSNKTYSFEYDNDGKLIRDINFRLFTIVSYAGPRPIIKNVPGTRDYYYNDKGDIDSVRYGHWDEEGLWVDDSSGYNIHYSSDGKVLSIQYFEKDSVIQEEENSYDLNGNLINKTVINYSNGDTTITNREYDLLNRLIFSTSIRTGNQTESQRLIQYDSSGNVNYRYQNIYNGDITSGLNYFLQFDENGKTIYEIFSLGYIDDSTWGQNLEILFDYDENGRILKMGDVFGVKYNSDGNLDSLINAHSVYCGYLGNRATLIDSYGNIITTLETSGVNTFYYSQLVTDIKDKKIHKMDFVLNQNYPNPFNPVTNISFTIKRPAKTSLVVYNILGEEIKSLVNEYKNPGKYTVSFDASDLASGIYFYKLQSGSLVQNRKMILIK